MLTFLMKTLVSGTAVSVCTAAALAMLARAEGRHPIQPLNSTSHWYRGEAAGHSRVVDASHTLLGVVTHHGASVFWAAIFQAVRRIRPDRPRLMDAVGVSAVAALVDYGVVPKQLTPGWEKVVSPTSIVLAYGAMAVALLATAQQRQEHDPR